MRSAVGAVPVVPVASPWSVIALRWSFASGEGCGGQGVSRSAGADRSGRAAPRRLCGARRPLPTRAPARPPWNATGRRPRWHGRIVRAPTNAGPRHEEPCSRSAPIKSLILMMFNPPYGRRVRPPPNPPQCPVAAPNRRPGVKPDHILPRPKGYVRTHLRHGTKTPCLVRTTTSAASRLPSC